MVRFIVRIETGDSISNFRDTSHITIDGDLKELEEVLTSGGMGENGFKIPTLIGAEIIEQSVNKYIKEGKR